MPNPRIKHLVALYIVAIGHEGAPSGHIYASLMAECQTLAVHQSIIALLTASQLVTQSNHFLRLTDKGLSLHKSIEAILKEQAQAALTIATQHPNG